MLLLLKYDIYFSHKTIRTVQKPITREVLEFVVASQDPDCAFVSNMVKVTSERIEEIHQVLFAADIHLFADIKSMRFDASF